MTTNDSQNTATATAPQSVKPHRRIKLGVEVHWRQHVGVRQIDGSSLQPPQRFEPEQFIAWVARQAQQADGVHCCYEAGPFGFGLHRRLLRLGIKSIVVRPRNWDEYGKKVKTDRRDALALVSCLDRFVAGNTEALTSIRIPIEAEEQSRSVSRQREQMLEHRKRLTAQGLSCARYHGHDLPDEWWRTPKFAALKEELPEFLYTLLEKGDENGPIDPRHPRYPRLNSDRWLPPTADHFYRGSRGFHGLVSPAAMVPHSRDGSEMCPSSWVGATPHDDQFGPNALSPANPNRPGTIFGLDPPFFSVPSTYPLSPSTYLEHRFEIDL